MAEAAAKTALAGIVVLVLVVIALAYGGGSIQKPTPDAEYSGQDGNEGDIMPQSRTQGSFSLTISPRTVTARPGETILYRVSVQPEDGFREPVYLAVSATALNGAISRSSNLGTISPPYGAVTREIVIPNLPPLVSGTTVDATITAVGGGTVRTQHLQLVIES
ncbi:hypothetical protein FGU65_10565 [Methanoculleus sp. FWC-SCC1]|uniref:Uncharacterized protein n=1 Tax=Methanoculleus frigidifontis TaxID=2584085 RepID=A0ABT8MBL9_9EURY|nr:hypothetical protein [Methanoculleus sp. FWC-SCC1]MDN7025330.1 hypothetical protein [Methanoculleus sp. FWC-SCC1]